jgi:hypothetical protein
VQTSKSTVEIIIEASEPKVRHREPVTCGVPWPRGMLRDPSYLVLRDDKGESVPLQTRIMDRWSDGSVRWLLLDWQATVRGNTTYRLQISESPNQTQSSASLRVEHADTRITVDTVTAGFTLSVGDRFKFERIDLRGRGATWIDTDFDAWQKNIAWSQPSVSNLALEDKGPTRATVRLVGELKLGKQSVFLAARLHFFSGSSAVRFCLSLVNTQRADHVGGFWELGYKRSIFIDGSSFTIDPDFFSEAKGPIRIVCSPELGHPFQEFEDRVVVCQGSGGTNWEGNDHLIASAGAPHSICGYRLRWDVIEEKHGRRATPIVIFEQGELQIALAMRYFWQNFPICMAGSDEGLGLTFSGDVSLELQGGEQKTHEFVVAFGKDTVTPDQPLEWVRSPLRVRLDPAWYAASGAVPYLTPEADDPNTDYIKLVRAAIEGEDTFEKKREVIDEYGWRNFGDIYADHEAVDVRKASGVSDDPGNEALWRQVSNLPEKGQVENLPPRARPLVSHYNNQYDPLAGFAIQFMRSGDWRWWDAMNELAAHVVDIDIYHTDQDKAAYNHGLFWHTVHYTDAGLSTHRSYPRPPRSLQGGMLSRPWTIWKKNQRLGIGRESMAPQRSLGGGPGNEHNYTTGLMLHYFLTGNPQSREAAIGLAQWVIDMDDGSKTIFRWLDRGNTGLASATVSPDYHGPGRGAGNSINALLDGHRLTGERRFLAKAEQLICRCIHPADDIPARNLLDAERRWSYTVFLQALGKYLDYKAEREELDWMYAYGRAALLHYARWMADHEHPYLEKPEILEYPTETWVAQDMRKSDVFQFAAKHVTGEERVRLLERSEFFFRYATSTLLGMKTRTLARPVVIMLSNGYMHAYSQQHPDEAAPPPLVNPPDFGRPEVFVSQKTRAKKRFVILSAIAVGVGLLAFLFWFLRM